MIEIVDLENQTDISRDFMRTDLFTSVVYLKSNQNAGCLVGIYFVENFKNNFYLNFF